MTIAAAAPLRRISLLLLPLCTLALDLADAVAASPVKAAAKAEANSTPGRDPGFGFVNLEQLLKNNAQIKTAEANLEAEKAAAQKDLESRVQSYQRLQADIAQLDQRLAAMKEGDPARAQTTREREEKMNVLKEKERDLNAFRQSREVDMQQKATTLRDPLITEIRSAHERLGTNINLLLDVTANTLSRMPFVVHYPSAGDVTPSIATAIEGKPPGSVNAMRGIKIALVDMNKVFLNLERTKEAQAKINQARNAAQSENEQRTTAYNEERTKLETLSGDEKEKQAEKVRTIEGELNAFRTKKVSELQEEVSRIGQPILNAMSSTLARIPADKVALVFDSSGMSVAGVPVLIWSKGIPDLSSELTTALNGDNKALGKTAGVSSSTLRFGIIDVERAYRTLPDGQRTEAEIQDATNRIAAELANADAQTLAQRQQQFVESMQGKRRAVLSKITAALDEIGNAGGFNAVLDTSGRTLARVPPVLATREIPDLTDEVVAKASAAQQ